MDFMKGPWESTRPKTILTYFQMVSLNYRNKQKNQIKFILLRQISILNSTTEYGIVKLRVLA